MLLVGRYKREPLFWVALFLLNLLTHPLAYQAALEGASFLRVEAAVVVVEGLGWWLITPLSRRGALGMAALTNLVSMAASFL